MGYSVFMHRSDSIYDDSPSERYQFPKQYLSRAEASVGDWIVYLEPSKVFGSRGYFAIARLQQIIPDMKASGMFIAIIEPGSYLEFVRPVPFRDGDKPIEIGLLNSNLKISGRAQSAIRPISPQDFQRIVEAGLEDDQPLLPRQNDEIENAGFYEQQQPYDSLPERKRIESFTSRIVRDRVFRKIILKAYDERCAITGLKLINGGGRAEVDAAHIRPVEANGPDIVNNGIALSGTAHWMFDRGLIALNDDLKILISRHVNDIENIRNFINASGFAHPPQHLRDYPHHSFLKWHRDNCFKA